MSILAKIKAKRDEISQLQHQYNEMINIHQPEKLRLKEMFNDGEAGRNRNYTWGEKQRKEVANKMASLTSKEDALQEKIQKKKIAFDEFLKANRQAIEKQIIQSYQKDVLEYEQAFLQAYNMGIDLKTKMLEWQNNTKPFLQLRTPPTATQVFIPFGRGNSKEKSDFDKLTDTVKVYKA